MSRLSTLGIDRLSVSERLSLIDEIWDSISEPKSLGELDVPDWHKTLLDERLADLEKTRDAGSSWEDVKARLWRKFQP